MTKTKFAFVLSVVLTVMIYLLISLGGLVRNAGAGLSCPDWPLCHGQVVPKQLFSDDVHATPEAQIPGHEVSPVKAHANAFQIFLEWFHRLIAGSVSVLLIVVTFCVFSEKDLRAKAAKANILAICFLIAQIVLGGLTVLGLLSPKWVSSHLAVGIAFFCSVLWMTLSIRSVVKASLVSNSSRPAFASLESGRDEFLTNAALITFLVVYFQIVLGGLVSSNYAGLACPDFPMCNGQLIPPLEGQVAFQFFHRLGFALVTIVLVAFTLISKKAVKTPIARVARLAIPLLLSVQILLGVGMIFMKLPLLMSVAHLAVAAALIGMVLILNFEFKNYSGEVHGH